MSPDAESLFNMPPEILTVPISLQPSKSSDRFNNDISVLSPYDKYATILDDSSEYEDELNGLAHYTPPILLQSSTSPSPVSGNLQVDRTFDAQTKTYVDNEPNRQTSERSATENPEYGTSMNTTEAGHRLPAALETTSTLKSVQNRKLVFPKSRYSGYVPPLPICEERIAVQDLLPEIRLSEALIPPSSHPSNSKESFLEIELSNFAVYLPENAWHSFELRGLQNLASLAGHSSLLFDGILSVGETRRYVQGVPFKVCSIGNYGEHLHEVGSDIWIQSDFNSNSEVYYRLGSPSSEYFRFHEGFLWLADLAKHFVDYCQNSERPVSVHDFRSDFSQWVQKTHESSSSFQNWYRKYARHDFRHALCRNIEFLFKESIGVDERLRSHPIWSELLEKDSIKQHPIKEVKTIVTPYVYDCFAHLSFGSHLKAVEPTKIAESRQTLQGQILDLTANNVPQQYLVDIKASKSQNPAMQSSKNGKILVVEVPRIMEPRLQRQRMLKAIKAGNVISVTKDGEGSVWKDEVSRWKAADDCWYVLVQSIHNEGDGERTFDGIWLYKPSDTSCAKMKYPFPNELFLSDNCTCSKGRITEDEVLDVIKVEWNGHPTANGNTFIRQTYIENEQFVTLKEDHKICQHLWKNRASTNPEPTPRYLIGQTVLVPPRQKSKYGLEVYEIVKYFNEGLRQYVSLRRLQRRSEVDGKGKPNELVYTEKQEKVFADEVHRTCLVRFYVESDIERHVIPAPYNRGGTGNAFYITTRLTEHNGVATLQPIERKLPRTLIQGFDPSAPPSRKLLRGLDLYCGGGNFGRGLEEGGAVKNKFAVDINETAVHTYAANLLDPSATDIYFGSVDDLLREALKGNPKSIDSVPLPGDVDFISAGSPCQGFSLLNSHRNGEKALKNQSLVASVAAYVDFYRPKYGLLENVMNMAQKGLGRDEDVLSQLICSLVGMGYQTQLFVLDSWSSGSPQSRSRLFISFAAPGLETLKHPALSHSHPPQAMSRGLGKLANGESFGSRLHDLTPFNYVSSSESIRDLPLIGDGRTYQCTTFPDHIERDSVTAITKLQIDAIPLYPRGCSFATAWNEGKGTMTKDERLLFPPEVAKSGNIRQCVMPKSKAWQRLHPDKLFSTITVAYQLQDNRSGQALHMDENRMISIMEARRAQTMPDDEILVGSRAQIWKVIGNSVARSVSIALGLALREAWTKNIPDVQPTLGEPTVHSVVPKSGSSEYTTLNMQAPLGGSVAQRLTHPFSINSARRVIESPLVLDQANAPALTGPNLKGGQQTKEGAIEDQLHATILDAVSRPSDEDDLSIHSFRKFLSSLSIKNTSAQDEATLPEIVTRSSRDNSDESRPLKRTHGTVRETRILTPQRKLKLPRLSGQASVSSSEIATFEAHQAKNKPLNPTELSNNLNGLRKAPLHRNRNALSSSREDNNFAAASDGDVETKSASPSFVESLSQLSPSTDQMKQTPMRSNAKAPSLTKSRIQVVIDFVSGEESSSNKTAKITSSKTNCATT